MLFSDVARALHRTAGIPLILTFGSACYDVAERDVPELEMSPGSGGSAGGSPSCTNASVCNRPMAIALGSSHSCALLGSGNVKCWGGNASGQLGLGDTDHRGDDAGEMGNTLPAVNLGTGVRASAIAAGATHTCALLDDGKVKCWGSGGHKLGLGDNESRGTAPGQMGDSLPAVDLGSGVKATAIAAGATHTCALLDDGQVKCWGLGNGLGLGEESRGAVPGQMGDNLPAVDLGSGVKATAIAAGIDHTCALLEGGALKCWGVNYAGQLGLGDKDPRGLTSGQMGDALPSVDLGTGARAIAITAGLNVTCAVLEGGTLKCWGVNDYLQLGLGSMPARGGEPGEMGDALPAVDLGTRQTATSVSSAGHHTCALLDGGAVKCWGSNLSGELGAGPLEYIGYSTQEMGDILRPVELGTGARATAIATADAHTCALLEDGRVKCWGTNFAGELGLGDRIPRGTALGQMGDELPAVDLGN